MGLHSLYYFVIHKHSIKAKAKGCHITGFSRRKKNGHIVQMNLSIGEQNSQNIFSWNNLKKNADFCDVLSDLGIFLSVFISY